MSQPWAVSPASKTPVKTLRIKRSVNEVICHGIPDKYPLKEGDIVNGTSHRTAFMYPRQHCSSCCKDFFALAYSVTGGALHLVQWMSPSTTTGITRI